MVYQVLINNWKDVGGVDTTIKRYARNNKSGTWDTFKSMVLGNKHALSRKSQRFESSELLSNGVSSDINAIGFVDLASIKNNKALAISDDDTTPISPEVVFVATEDYLLSRRLYMYCVPDRLNQHAQSFLDFVQSEEGQRIVSDTGFISQRPISINVEKIQGPDDYVNLVTLGERLSLNFRFKSGSSALDNKAKHDIMRLVEYMQTPEQHDKIVQLIGFGDSKERNKRALLLSKLRATSVRTELRKHNITTASVIGFGDNLPVASNAGKSRHKNQRVEVWIFDRKSKQELQDMKKDASIRKRQKSTTKLVSSGH